MHYKEMQFSTETYVINLRIAVIYWVPAVYHSILKSLFLGGIYSTSYRLLSSFQI